MIINGVRYDAVDVRAEENPNNYEIKDWMAVVVDGINVKADTWYELKDGELTECKEV